MERKQRTIKSEFSYTGIGLHTGQDVTIRCKPMPVDYGIRFKRIDFKQPDELEALVDNVISTKRCTTIGNNEWQINTIEHLMSALNGFNIDNLLIEIDANEPPVTDGSAKVFCDLLREAGIKKQDKKKFIYQIKEPLYVREDAQYLIVLPADEFKVSYTFVSNRDGLNDQFAEFIDETDDYYQSIALARTFGFASEIEALQEAGLGLGGSLENVVLVENDGPINQLRFENELARHKILDIMGDMKLAGDFVGHIIGVRSGHRLNSIMAKKIRKSIIREE